MQRWRPDETSQSVGFEMLYVSFRHSAMRFLRRGSCYLSLAERLHSEVMMNALQQLRSC